MKELSELFKVDASTDCEDFHHSYQVKSIFFNHRVDQRWW